MAQAFKDVDVAYEEELLRNPYNFKVWWQYIESKPVEARQSRFSLYERALKYLPGSYKLWWNYLRERREHVRGRCPTDPGFKEVIYTYERALAWMYRMPRIWMDLVEFLIPLRLITYTRRTFDKAFKSLPITQHQKLWPIYVKFVRQPWVPAETAVAVYRRYLKLEPEQVEEYIDYLLVKGFRDEAASLLAKTINDENFVSMQGKSSHQMWMQLCELISKHPKEIKSVPCEAVIRHGLQKFTDEVGHLWTALADYFVRLGQFEKARDIFEEGMKTVTTVRDFSLIFDAYAKFEENVIAAKMSSSQDDDVPEGDEDLEDFKDSALDIDLRLARLEHLMDRRPLLLSDVMLRQNPHHVHEWHKRVKLFQDEPEMVIKTYTDAVTTVDPQKAVGKPHTLWVNFARYYEANEDLVNARIIFEKATHVNYKNMDDLAQVWCEWGEMELRHKKLKEALKVMQKAVTPPRGQVATKDIVQTRLHRSIKVWSFYTDLEECLGTVATTKAAYDRMIELKIATPMTIINYATFLEEQKFFEDAFHAYEKGVNSFKWPHVYDLWVIYLTKFIQRYGGKKIERARDLFEQALEGAPANQSKKLYLLYAQMEENHGLIKHAMAVYDRAAKNVSPDEQLDMYLVYVSKTAEYFGITRTREIYETAIESLPEKYIKEVCLRYADLEKTLGEVDRARAIYTHCSQYCDPRKDSDFWKTWHQFEVKFGNEDTFRDMLRIKRSVAAQYAQINFVSYDYLAASHAAQAMDAKALERATAEQIAGQKRKLNQISSGMDVLEQEAAAAAASQRSLLPPPPPAQKANVYNEEEIELDGEPEETMTALTKKSVPSAVFGGLAEKNAEVVSKIASASEEMNIEDDEEEEAPAPAPVFEEKLGAKDRFKRARK